jgi:hypothetical protein
MRCPIIAAAAFQVALGVRRFAEASLGLTAGRCAYRERDRGAAMAVNALAYVRQNSWGEKKHDYLAVVRRLIDTKA